MPWRMSAAGPDARGGEAALRLLAAGEFRALRGPLGDLVLRPWFDWLALRFLSRCYLPVSRGWAAGLAAEGDPERFRAALPDSGLSDSRLASLLNGLSDRRMRHELADAEWRQQFFDGPEGTDRQRVRAELARRDAAHSLMAARSAFLPQRGRLPAVDWSLSTPDETEAAHGSRLSDPALAFPPPDLPEVELSRTVPGAYGAEYWLRYKAPVIGDTAWARVHEPPVKPGASGGSGPAASPGEIGVAEIGVGPTLIYLHGICMENEMWRGGASPLPLLMERGVRLLFPEGPWHGRRRPAGGYGGEPVIAGGPRGFLELFQAWIAEVAVLIDWAHRTRVGPVILGGFSLGSLTGQLVPGASQGWPQNLRPDALLLAATTGDLASLAWDGSLARELTLREGIEPLGWSAEEVRRWLPLLAPDDDPGLAPERIVMVLGRSDDLTPFDGGIGLARRWQVPEENLFLRRQGHFSVSLGLLRDPQPLDRLLQGLGLGDRR